MEKNIKQSSKLIIIKIVKDHWKELIAAVIFAFILYSVMITNELTNTYDGMWKGVYGYAGAWELSIGRWFWLTLDRVRLGVTTEPGISLLSLLIFSVGNIIVADLLQIQGKLSKIIFHTFMLANTAVCIFLSYRYMTLTFAFSYLLSVLGALAIISMYQYNCNKIVYSILAVVFITLSLGLYQANIGCTFVMLLVVLIKNLWINQNNSIKHYIKIMIHAILLIGCACIAYAGIWNLCLSLMHVEKGNYHGAGSVSVFSILSKLPKTIHLTYTSFCAYFLPGQWQNIYQAHYIFSAAVFILFIIIIIYSIFNRTKWSYKILSLISIILLPLLANTCLLLAPESGSMQLQMTMPMAMIIPGIFGLISSIDKKDHNLKLATPVSIIYFMFVIFIAFGNIMMVSTDQHVMLQSKNNSITLMNRIITNTSEELNAANENNMPVIFAGTPANSPLYQKDLFWDKSNHFAHYGEFWIGGNCITQSYYGFLRDCGININLLTDDQKYHQITDSQEVQKMPMYPRNGYAKEIDGCLVIKISQ